MGFFFRRRCIWRCCRSCSIVCILFWSLSLVMILSSDDGRRAIRLLRYGIDCSDIESMEFIQETCRNYSKGLIPGSFCKPLCSSDVRYKACLGHGVKPHVLLLEYLGKDIILKAKRQYSSHFVRHKIQELKKEKVYSYKEFIKIINRTLSMELFAGKDFPKREALDKLFDECDINTDRNIHFNEAASCMRIFGSEEYIFYLLLHGTQGIPEIYGTCGNLFAVESSPAVRLRAPGFVQNPKTWQKRAKIALSMLDMVEAFEKTQYGTLYLCDVQEINFGVTERSDGTYEVLAIDMDISFFEKQMHYMAIQQAKAKKKCQKHEDCDFMSCWSECDMEQNICKPELYSSNLQIICSEIFHSYGAKDPGLLYNPPETIREHLEDLLQKCSDPSDLILYADDVLVRSPLDVLNELRSVLKKSI